jgi:hypothetical protein
MHVKKECAFVTTSRQTTGIRALSWNHRQTQTRARNRPAQNNPSTGCPVRVPHHTPASPCDGSEGREAPPPTPIQDPGLRRGERSPLARPGRKNTRTFLRARRVRTRPRAAVSDDSGRSVASTNKPDKGAGGLISPVPGRRREPVAYVFRGRSRLGEDDGERCGKMLNYCPRAAAGLGRAGRQRAVTGRRPTAYLIAAIFCHHRRRYNDFGVWRVCTYRYLGCLTDWV